ncbi:MAG: ribosome assembly protein YihI (activator of Der GTPase) [Psychromonas sp.]|jgi:ribosome assembly protein YihI (activator of Der GTPase)|uniref:Der GTPase-activating protein YihI n=1 Tax=Psychromonas sp. TaxID=1884585 RepID=UPI0039E30C75
MSRTKKNRTSDGSEPKFSGQRKESSSQAKDAREKKRKTKLKGNKPGGRNANESKPTQENNAKQALHGKRLGSQKAVPLVIGEKPQNNTAKAEPKTQEKVIEKEVKEVEVKEKLSPEKELALIENDDRLNDLLEQLDNEQTISQSDQSWLNKQTKRHQQLMKELGWLDDDGEEDLLQQFEDASSALDEFR